MKRISNVIYVNFILFYAFITQDLRRKNYTKDGFDERKFHEKNKSGFEFLKIKNVS